MSTPRFAAAELISFARALLIAAKMEEPKAQAVAEILVEADLLGHDTHGLHLLAPYLNEIDSGKMKTSGQPEIVSNRPAAIAWDGNRLPGPWLVKTAIDTAIPRAKELGTCSVVIRRSHHIACLAAYLKRVTDEGLMILLCCSAPDTVGVAPHGGRRSVITPNPIAAGWPTDGEPVLLDISASITTLGLSNRLYREGKKLPGAWLVDANGALTDDPAVLFQEPKGALLPLGGLEAGHKGYALGLLVEALTGGLVGHGRADPAEGWSGNVFLEIFEPEAFGGRADFLRQMTWLADACRAVPPRPGVERVRLPGENGLKRRARQVADGVDLHPAIVPALKPWCEKLTVEMPAAVK